MKVRTGFVSNSSSTSFAIYGVCIDEDTFEKLLKTKGIEVKEDFDCLFELDKYVEWEESMPMLDIIRDSECEAVYIGRWLSDIGDNETGGEFRKSVEEAIKKELGISQCSNYIEEIYS